MPEIRYLQPISPAAATGLVAEVYSQARREFGLLPPIPLHSPVPRLLTGAWCVLRETIALPAVLRRSSRPVACRVRRWPSWSPPICRPTSPGTGESQRGRRLRPLCRSSGRRGSGRAARVGTRASVGTARCGLPCVTAVSLEAQIRGQKEAWSCRKLASRSCR